MKITKSPKLVFALVLSIFAIYAGAIVWNVWPIDSKTIGQAGVFGDSFGVLTSLFSGLAFAGLIITIWQQQEELTLTRDEIKKQHFENMLFRMLEIHNSIVNDFDLRYTQDDERHKEGDISSRGRDCFFTFHENLKMIYSHELEKDSSDILAETYEKFWCLHKRDLGHYFRYLYNIFKFIDNSRMKEKKVYSSIVRAQLSDYELAILFYNCISINGNEKFKPLVEEFHLLDNLPRELLLDKEHYDMYPSCAYDKS